MIRETPAAIVNLSLSYVESVHHTLHIPNYAIMLVHVHVHAGFPTWPWQTADAHSYRPHPYAPHPPEGVENIRPPNYQTER